MKSTLKWVERGLMIVGVVLAFWSAMVMLQARFFGQLPVPSPQHQPPGAVTALPGDAGNPGQQPAPRHVATGSWLARLDAPSVRLSATVLEGSDDATLAKGAGHIEDTPFPGEAGNVGIAGHRDTTFRAVRNLKVGDPLVVTTADRVQTYRITWMKVVEPDDVYVLDPTKTNALTLVTCFPFEYIGHAPHRYIVRAELTAEDRRTTENNR